MKKRNIFFIALAFLFSIIWHFNSNVFKANAEEMATHSVQVHFRSTRDYSKCDIWMWNITDGGAGTNINFTSTDEFGASTDEVLLTSLPGSGTIAPSQIGIIYRSKGAWSWQSQDITVDIPNKSEGGVCHVYLIDGSSSYTFTMPETGYIKSATFVKMNQIEASIFILDSSISSDDLGVRVMEDMTNEMEIQSCTLSKLNEKLTIVLAKSIDLNKIHSLVIDFNSKSFTSVISTNGIYDDEAFITNNTYTGDDLGAVINKSRNVTTFKLWAPTCSNVKIKLYNTGTPARLGGNDEAQVYEMTKEQNGVWSYEAQGNLHNTYYNYEVTNSAGVNEAVDPYAKGCGVNGLRGLVVDFEQVNPEGFTYGKRAQSIAKRSDATIYELHIRDYTKSENWGGEEANRGKYLGLAERGTYYRDRGQEYKTGLDHLIELGVTNIQILPFYDQATVDEAAKEPSYNWGYDPLNYNCLEGSYASDAKDGLVRIREFKQMMMALTDAGIRVNMDVVYNHTAKSADSNFDLIVPGYYHRMTADGSFSNGSGCGNEMASERPMVRKFMIDSTKFLYNEYNLSGFRFDLMQLIDKTTMMEIYNEITSIDPLALIYGEPWTGGTSTLPDGQGTGKEVVKYLVSKDEEGNVTGGVGKFNDDTRDGIIGRVPFSPSTPGWVQGYSKATIGATNYLATQFGIVGGTQPLSTGNVLDATQTINYVSCHDNNTLWDKLHLSLTNNNWKLEYDNNGDNIKKMNRQADTIVFFSEGIPFIQEGQEFLRSKPKLPGYGEGSIYDGNSYCSPDEVNMIRWELKSENYDVFQYYKDLYQFRKDHEAFKLTSASEIAEKLEFIDDDNTANYTAFVYRIKEDSDRYQDMYIIHNTAEMATFSLPQGKWKIAFDSNGIVTESQVYEGSIKLEYNQSVVLYNIKAINNPNSTGGCSSCGKASMSIFTVLAAIMIVGTVCFKKKEVLGA